MTSRIAESTNPIHDSKRAAIAMSRLLLRISTTLAHYHSLEPLCLDIRNVLFLYGMSNQELSELDKVLTSKRKTASDFLDKRRSAIEAIADVMKY